VTRKSTGVGRVSLERFTPEPPFGSALLLTPRLILTALQGGRRRCHHHHDRRDDAVVVVAMATMAPRRPVAALA
jgi:hypothetical protein